MITYWQQIEGQFKKTKKDDIDESLPVWVDARSVTRDETTFLQEEYQTSLTLMNCLVLKKVTADIFLQLSVFLFTIRQLKHFIIRFQSESS